MVNILAIVVATIAIVVLYCSSINRYSFDAKLSPIWSTWSQRGISFAVLEVPRAQWKNHASTLFNDRQPVVLESTPAVDWKAMKGENRWTPNYLSRSVPLLKGVRVLRRPHTDPTFMYYEDSMPFINLAELAALWKPNFQRVNLSAGDFFLICDQSSSHSQRERILSHLGNLKESDRAELDMDHIYYSAHIREWENSEAFKQVGDHAEFYRDYLAARYASISAEERPNLTSQHVWMGSNGVTAAAHYDGVHNLYVQLYGYKRFVLFPPATNRFFYTYPRLHPSARQSQVNFADPASSDLFPLLYASSGRGDEPAIVGYDVMLGPGDVLYLPPYWFHYVSAVNTSISISLWIDTEELVFLTRAVRAPVTVPTALPTEHAWAPRIHFLKLVFTKLSAVLNGWLRLLSQYRDVSQAEQFLRTPAEMYHDFIYTRYIDFVRRHHWSPSFDAQKNPACDFTSIPTPGRSQESLDRMDTHATEVALHIGRVPPFSDAELGKDPQQIRRDLATSQQFIYHLFEKDNLAIIEIHLYDFIEEFANAAVGTEKVVEFLWAMYPCIVAGR